MPDADKSIGQLRSKVPAPRPHPAAAARQRLTPLAQKVVWLRAEAKALRRERNAAVRDRQDADIAWNELVTGLKQRAFAANERCTAAEARLAPATEELERERAAHAATQEQLAAATAALASLLPAGEGGGGEGGDMLPQNPSEGAQAVREAFDAARERYCSVHAVTKVEAVEPNNAAAAAQLAFDRSPANERLALLQA